MASSFHVDSTVPPRWLFSASCGRYPSLQSGPIPRNPLTPEQRLRRCYNWREAQIKVVTILFAEDEEMLRRLIGRALRGHGFEVIEAASGTEAVRAARNHAGTIDLLVTDIVMPGLTGRELAEQLRLVRPSISVLYISGYYAEGQLQLAPGSAFLGKPFTPAELLDKIQDVLDIGEGTRELAR